MSQSDNFQILLDHHDEHSLILTNTLKRLGVRIKDIKYKNSTLFGVKQTQKKLEYYYYDFHLMKQGPFTIDEMIINYKLNIIHQTQKTSILCELVTNNKNIEIYNQTLDKLPRLLNILKYHSKQLTITNRLKNNIIIPLINACKQLNKSNIESILMNKILIKNINNNENKEPTNQT